MKKIKFAIIGCGKIGTRHAEKMQLVPEAELYAVCDVIEARAKAVADKYKCKYYTDYHELLKDKKIEVVNVCVPNGLHAQVSIDAMDAKKNVLCEKPMCITLKDADKMVEAQKKNNVKFFLVKQNRYNPPIVALKEAVTNNKLGKIYMVNSTVFWNRNQAYYDEEAWRGTKNMDGGTLYTQCSHFLDLMLWLGGDVKSIHAKMELYNHDIETEDTGVVLLKFKNGALGVLQYTTCAYEKNMEGSLTVMGTKGSAKAGGQYLNEMEYWNVENTPMPKIEESAEPNTYGTYQGSMSNHDKVIAHVADVLLHGGNPGVPVEQGRYSVKIMEAAYKSAQTGKEIVFND